MLPPELTLKFQQTFKQLQIHAGMGVTEDNIHKISLIADELSLICGQLYGEVYTVDEEGFKEEIPVKKSVEPKK